MAGAGWNGSEEDLVVEMLELALRGEEREDLVERETGAVTVRVYGVLAERARGRVAEGVCSYPPAHLLEQQEQIVAENGSALVDERFHPKRLAAPPRAPYDSDAPCRRGAQGLTFERGAASGFPEEVPCAFRT